MSAIHTQSEFSCFWQPFLFRLHLPIPLKKANPDVRKCDAGSRSSSCSREVDVRLDDTRQSTLTPSAAESAESPCFPIHTVTLTGDAAGRFQFALKKALKETGFQSGQCLGAQGVNRIMVAAQNAVIGHGYTTTRILAAPQDLNSGTWN